MHEISIPNHFKIRVIPCLARVCMFSFELVVDFFIIQESFHLHLELLSIARHESPGSDWLRASLIRVGTIYPSRIGYIGQFHQRYSFCSCRSFVSPGLVSIPFSYSPRKKENDRTNWKQFIKILPYSICVSLNSRVSFHDQISLTKTL